MASERLIKLGLATADSDPLETLATGAVEGWPLGLLQDAVEDARAGVQRLRAQVQAGEEVLAHADRVVTVAETLNVHPLLRQKVDRLAYAAAAAAEAKERSPEVPQ